MVSPDEDDPGSSRMRLLVEDRPADWRSLDERLAAFDAEFVRQGPSFFDDPRDRGSSTQRRLLPSGWASHLARRPPVFFLWHDLEPFAYASRTNNKRADKVEMSAQCFMPGPAPGHLTVGPSR